MVTSPEPTPDEPSPCLRRGDPQPPARGPLVAILSGAGISTDSGIPDYRGPQGLWRSDPEAEKLVTYDYYMTDPDIRRRSWQMRLSSPTWNAVPNAAHEAVAKLEQSGKPVRVITQNVDGLHQLAGLPDRKVLELHGSSRTVICTECGDGGPMAEALERVEAGEDDPDCCTCGGILKSATVMFGQALDPEVLGQAVGVAKACDVFVAVGTSLQVQPAASLAEIAVEHGARLVIVNAEPTPYDGLADEVVREPISEALPALLDELHQL
ncbi:MAG TPA: Sir2 family NAD-dependent protein deacetylase [Streptomyces sp.]|nr:Sir2 family NAD-dependent protein deacetylase [Streptomyces sp.]